MDKTSQENFDRIIRTAPEALSKGDIDFLRARRSYLTASDSERYSKVLGVEQNAPADEDSEQPKKGKK